jgi:succinate dehydrogenase / fumarate reductase membrane anchor subunit
MKPAFSGFRAWLVQRVTALFLVLGSLLLLSLFLCSPASGFSEWQAWTHSPVTVIALLLFSVSIALHAWVGMRDVIMDYVHVVGLRLTALSVLALYLLGSLFWLLWILV